MKKKTSETPKSAAPARKASAGSRGGATGSRPQSRGAQVFDPPKGAWLFSGVVLFYFILQGLKNLYLGIYDWGFGHVAFLPGWAQWGWTLLAVALVLPLVYRPAQRLAATLFADASSRTLPATFAIAGAVLFWVLAMETYFLGDGAVYLAEHFRYVRGLDYSSSVLYSKGSAPLTGWLLAQVAAAAHALSGGEGVVGHPMFAFRLTGLIAGVIFILVAWCGAHRLWPDLDAQRAQAAGVSVSRATERLATFVLLVTTAASLYFFGYVEYYTFVFVALAAHMIALDRAARGDIGFMGPILLLLLAIAFHFLAVLALPALVATMLARSRTQSLARLGSASSVLAALGVVLVGAGIWYFASGTAAEGSRTVLSLDPYGSEGRWQLYTLLSVRHVLDIILYVILLMLPPLYAIGWISRPKKSGYAWHRAWAGDAAMRAATLNLLFFLMLAVFGNTAFGLARDWDIVAVLGVATVLYAVTVLRARQQWAVESAVAPTAPPAADTDAEPEEMPPGETDEGPAPVVTRRRTTYALVVAAGFSFGAFIPWVYVNVDADASVARYRSILTDTDSLIMGDYALNGYEHLRKYYQSTGDGAGEAWAIRKKIECVGYPMDFRKYMLAVVTHVPAGTRRAEFEWMLDDIARRLELMNAGRTDSLYAGTRSAFIELAAEVLLQVHALPPAEGVTATWLDGRLDRLAALGASSRAAASIASASAPAAASAPGTTTSPSSAASIPAAVAIARAQIAWDRTGAIADAAPFLRAPEIATSSLLAFHAGRALLAIKLREQSRAALERAVALDPDFTLPLVFLAAAEYEISTANAPRAVAHLEAFLARPEGRRLPPGDPTNQKLEAYARGLLARIRP